MANEKRLTIDIIVRSGEARSELKKFSKDVSDTGKKSKKAFKSVSSDVDIIAKTARKFSDAWKVSFKDAYAHVKEMGIGFKSISYDMDIIAKTARNFSQEWGVSFKSAYSHVKKMGVGMENTAKKTEKAGKGMSMNLTLIAWHFRYIGATFTRISQQWFRLASKWVTTAADIEESFFSIRAAAAMYGQNAEEATKLTWKIARGGLVPLADAANAVRNLLMTGIGMPELEKFSYRYLDVASLTTSGMKDMEKSLTLMTQSILRGTLVLATDVTARKLWTETDKRLQKTMGTTLKGLNARQRAIEILETIEKNYAATLGLHEAEEAKMSATLGRIKTAYQEISLILGNSLRPAVEIIAKLMQGMAIAVGKVVKALGPLMWIVNILGVSFTALLGVLFSTAGVAWSIRMVIKKLAVVMAVLHITTAHAAKAQVGFTVATKAATASIWGLKVASWEFWVITTAIAGVVVGLVWLFKKFTKSIDGVIKAATIENKALTEMRNAMALASLEVEDHTNTLQGLIDKINELETTISGKRKDYERSLARLVLKHSEAWRGAVRDTQDATAKMKKALLGLTESHKETNEDAELAYRRKREDIEEEINRELSKGLWADQLKIKENQKTLKRIDEDHARSQKKEEKTYEERKKTIMETYRDELLAAKKAMSEIAILWAKHQDEVKEGARLMKTLPDVFEEIAESFAELIKDETKALEPLKQKLSEVNAKIKEMFPSLVEFGRIFLEVALQPPQKTLTNIFNLIPRVKTAFVNFIDDVFGKSKPLAEKWKEIEGIWTRLKLIKGAWEPAPLGKIGETGLFEPFAGGTVPDYIGQPVPEKPKKPKKPKKEPEKAPIGETFKKVIKPIDEVFKKLIKPIGEVFKKLKKPKKPKKPKKRKRGFQFGGIVPGRIGQPMPIMAHGGERIVPSRDAGGGSPITVNIVNPTVRSSQDIRDLAYQIKTILGQRAKYARMGGF